MNNLLQSTDFYIERFLNNDITETIKTCTKLIKSDDADYLTYFKLGFAYFVQNNQEQAIINFNKSIKLNSKYIHSYYFIGCAFLNIDIHKSIENFIKALELSPNESLLLFYLGFCYNKTDAQKAIKYYTKCIDTNYAMSIDAYYYRAECYYSIKKYNLAIIDIDKVIYLNPNYYGAQSLKEKAYAHLK